jgi:LDH2 family malate/lactate/ureidoglycolate dehydrogenase
MSNTTPLMPPPGGAEPVVGNNPVAVAVPLDGEEPLLLDIALSAVAGGKLRYAAHAGRAIPPDWATDGDGVPTTDPAVGLLGMLLPLGGHKGFGLALVVDALCGLLAGGAFGAGVRSLYREMEQRNDCGHFFLALDVEAFDGLDAYAERARAFAAAIHGARRAPGVERLYLPGEIEAEAARRSRADGVELDEGVLEQLDRLARDNGVAPVARSGNTYVDAQPTKR